MSDDDLPLIDDDPTDIHDTPTVKLNIYPNIADTDTLHKDLDDLGDDLSLHINFAMPVTPNQIADLSYAEIGIINEILHKKQFTRSYLIETIGRDSSELYEPSKIVNAPFLLALLKNQHEQEDVLEIYRKLQLPLTYSITIDHHRALARSELIDEMDTLLENYQQLLNSFLQDYSEVMLDRLDAVHATLCGKLRVSHEDGFGLALFSNHAITNMMSDTSSFKLRIAIRENNMHAIPPLIDQYLKDQRFSYTQLALARWAIGPRSNDKQPNVKNVFEYVSDLLKGSSLEVSDIKLPSSDELAQFSFENLKSGLFFEVLMEIISNVRKYGGEKMSIEAKIETDKLVVTFKQDYPKGKLSPAKTSGAGFALMRAIGLDPTYTFNSENAQPPEGETTIRIPLLNLVEA